MDQPDNQSTADRLSAVEREIDVLQGQVLRAGGEAAVCHAAIIDLKACLMERASDFGKALQAALCQIDQEIEQRKQGGNDEAWANLQAVSDAGHAALRKASRANRCIKGAIAALALANAARDRGDQEEAEQQDDCVRQWRAMMLAENAGAPAHKEKDSRMTLNLQDETLLLATFETTGDIAALIDGYCGDRIAVHAEIDGRRIRLERAAIVQQRQPDGAQVAILVLSGEADRGHPGDREIARTTP